MMSLGGAANRHCEARSAEAIQLFPAALDCFAPLAMTENLATESIQPELIRLTCSLSRPRRAAQRLRWPAESSDDGTVHPFGLAKAG
jgi:hypothetical protein